MNDKFDELAKNMAQSVTRRGALNKFGVGLAGITHGVALILGFAYTLSLLICDSASAQQFSPWSAPVNLGSSINKPFEEFHPAISEDGLTLFCSSNRPGGFGQTDVWVAQRPN